jgi:hypothetical protein
MSIGENISEMAWSASASSRPVGVAGVWLKAEQKAGYESSEMPLISARRSSNDHYEVFGVRLFVEMKILSCIMLYLICSISYEVKRKILIHYDDKCIRNEAVTLIHCREVAI